MVLVGIAAKIYEAMGFQRWLPIISINPESMSKSKHDHMDRGYTTAPGEPSVVVDENYISWLNEHPSAISSFQRMINAAKGKQIAVFLDYDGTLSPIVCDPNRAFMSDQMREAVREVSKHFPTAIISGRSREKVHSFVKLKEVYYSGSHGMDTMGPLPLQATRNKSYDDKYHYKTTDEEGNEFIVFQPAKDFLPAIEKMLIEMRERTRSIKGVVIEDNRFCLSVHYRHVKDDEEYERLEEQVVSVLEKYPEFHMTRGKKVMEIRPSIEWNKGHALDYLLHNLSCFHNSRNILPIYIGDDKTDEDAFKVLRERGEGFPIVVSSKPRETMAFHSLHDPSEVLSFLIRLGRWGFDNAHSIQA